MPADHEAETSKVLGFPARPGGSADDVRAARHHWYEVAEDMHRAFQDIEAALTAASWSGTARAAFNQVWQQFSQHAAEAQAHCREVGDHLLRMGNQIEDSQHEWDMAMTGAIASAAVGLGLTFFTFGISDEAAEMAAGAAVGMMEATCTALDIAVAGLVAFLEQAIRLGAQLAVKFALQFSIDIVGQEGASLLQRHSLTGLHLGQAAEYAAFGTILPEVATSIEVGGKAVLGSPLGSAAFDVSAAMAADAGVQGIEKLTEGKDFDPAELGGTGLFALAGHGLARASESVRSHEIELRDTGSFDTISRQDLYAWRHRAATDDMRLDALLDKKLGRAAEGAEVRITRSEAKRLLIREKLDSKDGPEVAEAKVLRALKRVKSFDDGISLRVSPSGEKNYRYTDGQDRGSVLTSTVHYHTSAQARRGLHLDSYDLHGWLRQAVTTERPTLMLEGRVHGGVGHHSIVLRDDELNNLRFGKASRYGISASAEEAAADLGRIPHDMAIELSDSIHPDRDPGQSLLDDTSELTLDAESLRWK